MKRTYRLWAALTALVLCCALCLSAAAEGELFSLADQGHVLLLYTDNVTIKAHAEFDLDGVRFKTADVLYIQDGSNSLWQLGLLTPQPQDTDKESGFTIIANGMNFYVMEKLRPGTYRSGSDFAQSSILRHSAEAENLGSLAASLADLAEKGLAPGALTVTREESGETEYALEIKESELPFWVNAAVNLYAEFALQRFMGVDYDNVTSDSQWGRDNYDTITQWILYGTRAFVISDSSVKIRTDEAGQIIAAGGTVRVRMDLGEAKENLLEIRFDAAVSDYGTSRVARFNPNDYEVFEAVDPYAYTGMEYGTEYDPEPEDVYTPAEADPETARSVAERTGEAIAAAGFAGQDLSNYSVIVQDGFYAVRFFNPEDGSQVFEATVAKDGQVLYLDYIQSGYYSDDLAGGEPDGFALTDEQKDKLTAALDAAYPGISARCASWSAVYQCANEEGSYIVLDAKDESGEITGVFVTLRLAPEWQVVTMSLLAALY